MNSLRYSGWDANVNGCQLRQVIYSIIQDSEDVYENKIL
jgi:hypothetical protein